MPPEGSKGFLGYAARGFFENGGQRLYVARTVGDGATTASRSLLAGTGQRLILEAAGPGAWGSRVFASVRRRVPGRFRLTLLYYREVPPLPLIDPLDPTHLGNADRREPDVVEIFDSLDAAPDSDHSVVSVVNARSQLVRVRWSDPDASPARPRGVAFGRARLRGGLDGALGLSAAQYLGDAHGGTGIHGLSAIDDIALLCVPDDAHPDLPKEEQAALRSALVEQCRERGRFAVLNGPPGSYDPTQLESPLDTEFAAMYLPWVRVTDEHGGAVLAPPGGHVCGVYARSDAQRGVQHAPANELILGLLAQDLPDGRGPLEFRFSPPEEQALAARRINQIRDLRANGRGIRVWSARTLSSDPDWRYVNLRRLCVYLEQSIFRGLRWAVFETNGEVLWQRVRNSIDEFLLDVWRSGALAGARPEDAFLVRCDRSTMTQDDLDNGRLIAIIGVAPVSPAEFVILRIGLFTADDDP